MKRSRVARSLRALALASAVLLPDARAQAQQSPPAVAPQEPIEPDRPDVTNGTHIVDVGLLQIEVGGLFTRAARSQRAFGSPLTARLGVAEWLELRVGTDGFLSQDDGVTSASGIGNVQVGAKLRLWADPGGIPVLSVLPTINLPTASAEKALGSGAADYTIALLTGRDLGSRWHVDVNYGLGAMGAAGGQPHFAQHLASVSASVSAGPRLNPYVEAFWFSRQDPAGGAMTASDFGAIYTFNPKLAIDGGIQVGLSRAAPAFAAFGGLSIVVGNVAGEHGVHARQRSAEKRARARARH